MRPRGGGSRRGKKGGFAETLAAEIDAEIDALAAAAADGGQDFEALEQAVRRRALDTAARALERRLNADRADHQGSTVPCACGQEARYAGRQPKTFLSVLGPLRLERARFHCGACRTGVYPRDRALGLEGASLSPAITRMAGSAAAEISFEKASELVGTLAGVRVETKQVERTAEALGRRIAAEERTVTEPAPAPAPTVYLGLDGTGVPVRPAEVEGRPGKQPDGSAKTREVKLVTVWTAESRDKRGRPVRDPGSVSYSAAVESAAGRDTDPRPSPFAQRVYREAQRRGFDAAERRVVLGDGAPWIWNLAGEQFPGAVEIVDIYHAKQHLSDAAKALYGPGADRADAWARQRHDELDDGRLRAIVAELRPHTETADAARRRLDYIVRNRRRMCYPRFRARGLCVSSGVVEAGCKRVVGARLKRAGMRWTVAGANAIIALLCCQLSGRYEDYWEQRAARAA